MGNRSSSHYLPPPGWPHGPPYPAYAAPPGGAHDPKRISAGAFVESYVPHSNLRRSMVSLNADSGYLTSPSDSERLRARGSRMSLNHLDFERQLVFPSDLKTIKKLEKMEKKQQKLLKKIGARPMPPPPPSAVFMQPHPMPPPPPLYSRAMSFDDLHRAHLAAAADSRYQEQCRMGAHFRSPVEHHMARSFLSTHPTSGRVARNGSSMTSSPVTSVSDEHTGERWISSPIRRDAREDLSPMSETSAQLTNITRSSDASKSDKSKTVEIKVQRTERVERSEKFDNKDWLNNNDTYAMPRMQPSFGSRSSLATSQARGESSDIDFSWIREEEKKLKNERENSKRLPECYFGMDPPKLQETPLSTQNGGGRIERDGKENRRAAGNVRSTASAFENELMKEKRDQAYKSRSSTHLEDRQMEYSARREVGPMARRLQRMQREAEVANRNYSDHDVNRQRWRSSMAF